MLTYHFLIDSTYASDFIDFICDNLFGTGEKSHIAPVGKSQFLTNEKNQNYPSYTSFLE